MTESNQVPAADDVEGHGKHTSSRTPSEGRIPDTEGHAHSGLSRTPRRTSPTTRRATATTSPTARRTSPTRRRPPCLPAKRPPYIDLADICQVDRRRCTAFVARRPRRADKMDERQRIAVLEGCVLFTGLPATSLQQLAAQAAVRNCRRGQILFAEGDPGDSLLVVVSGSLKAYTTSEQGDEFLLAVVGPGEVLGELAIADGGVPLGDSCCTERSRRASLAKERGR